MPVLPQGYSVLAIHSRIYTKQLS